MIRMLKDNVLVRLDRYEMAKSVGGIVMPGTSNPYGDKMRSGIVVGVGPGGMGYNGGGLIKDESERGELEHFGVDVAPGDLVLFKTNCGEPISMLGGSATHPEEKRHDEYVVLSNNQIEAVVEEE